MSDNKSSIQIVDLVNLIRALNIANCRKVFTEEEIPKIEKLWNKMDKVLKIHGVDDIYFDLEQNKDSILEEEEPKSEDEKSPPPEPTPPEPTLPEPTPS